MNGNANLNANNLTPQNVEDWRNKLDIKPNAPINKYDTLTPTNNKVYEMVDDGWLAIRGGSGTGANAYHHITFYNQTTGIYNRNSGYGNGATTTNWMPVRKGDKVQLSWSNMSGTWQYFRFYYYR